ncbi:ubiquitin-conjugating enzyme E2 Q2-like isoform X2 [Mizuhopecten yessoensis]|uniref:ubiquitin-conjugating enzyme E2 Q2-like isoform X2 n=1 Tax=Mizuhopecten yessoensis TaxID=6573 RepID=UPI000B45E52D|nr:ubiquitin-conjugating enzyme E2 Q2-like isoform X2 [Mizuhopecten yessoensis]
MEFPQLLISSEAWSEKSGSKFKVLSSDEEEKKVLFHVPDTEITFHLSICDISEDKTKLMVWSNNDNVLPYLNDVQEFTESCKPVHVVLDKVDTCLKPLVTTALADDDDEDEGCGSDDNDDYGAYYDNEDLDADQEEVPKVKEASEDEDEENFFGAQGTPGAVQRLLRDLKGMKESYKFGIEGRPRGDNLFIWDVKLKDFPPESKLGKDLQNFADKFKREPAVYIEMHFPGEYPMKPPFVRILRPRFKFLTGHVTIGGSICMQMLTNSGWTPTNDIEAILVQIRSEIMSDPNAQLERSDSDRPYGEQEARDAFTRMVKRYGW